MDNFRSTLARFRLLSSVIALAVLLSALAVTPARAEFCDNICSAWTIQTGCTTCVSCCFEGNVSICKPKTDHDCGTGGPGYIE